MPSTTFEWFVRALIDLLIIALILFNAPAKLTQEIGDWEQTWLRRRHGKYPPW